MTAKADFKCQVCAHSCEAAVGTSPECPDCGTPLKRVWAVGGIGWRWKTGR